MGQSFSYFWDATRHCPLDICLRRPFHILICRLVIIIDWAPAPYLALSKIEIKLCAHSNLLHTSAWSSVAPFQCGSRGSSARRLPFFFLLVGSFCVTLINGCQSGSLEWGTGRDMTWPASESVCDINFALNEICRPAASTTIECMQASSAVAI